MARYTIENNADGPVFVARGRWLESFERIIEQRSIRQLQLLYSDGWRGATLEFLKRLPHLQGLRIWDTSGLDVRGISYLSNLKRLRLNIGEIKVRSVAFEAIDGLESCELVWNRAFTSILECRSLRRLEITDMRGIRILDLRRLANLQELWLTRAPKLIGIEFPLRSKLEKLFLRKLQSLTGVDSWKLITETRHLWLAECKQLCLADVIDVKSLRELVLVDMGHVKTLSFIRELPHLERLELSGSTTIDDGDLSFISRLNRIKSVSFPPRTHYNTTLAELREALDRTAHRMVKSLGNQ